MSLNCGKCGSLREKSFCCSKTLPCKECARVKALVHYYQNSEKYRERQLEYYKNTREKVLHKQKEYRDRDKNLYNQRQREQYRRRKVEKLLSRYEALEIETVG